MVKQLSRKEIILVNRVLKLFIDRKLTDGCMVDAVKTATEAKSVVLRELDVKSYVSGELASGTITDAVVVSCTRRGKPIKYAGTGTKLGELIGKSVRRAVKEAIQKQDGIPPRPSVKRLEKHSLTLKNIKNRFLELIKINK